MTGRAGRPAVGGLVRDARLGDDLLAAVEQLAAAEGVSRSEMLRRLVGEAVAHRPPPAAGSEMTITSTELTAWPDTSLDTHLALHGAAAIIEDAHPDRLGPRLAWPHTGRHPVIDADLHELAAAVHAHASTHTRPSSWIARDTDVTGAPRGLFSPRITAVPADRGWPEQRDEAAGWRALHDQRQAVLDELTAAHAWLDLRMIAALGEPSHWADTDAAHQWGGATALDFTVRLRGDDLIRTRVRPLVAAVAALGVDGVATDLTAGTGPGFDWCATWGISAFPIAPRMFDRSDPTRNVHSITSAHLPIRDVLVLPIWRGQWTAAKARTALASADLNEAAGKPARLDATAARERLRAVGVTALITIPVLRDAGARATTRAPGIGQRTTADEPLSGGSGNPVRRGPRTGRRRAVIPFVADVLSARETLAAHTPDTDDLLIHARASSRASATWMPSWSCESACSTLPSLVELTVPDTGEERLPLRGGEVQGASSTVLGVAHQTSPVGQVGDLHALVAAAAEGGGAPVQGRLTAIHRGLRGTQGRRAPGAASGCSRAR